MKYETRQILKASLTITLFTVPLFVLAAILFHDDRPGHETMPIGIAVLFGLWIGSAPLWTIPFRAIKNWFDKPDDNIEQKIEDILKDKSQ